VYCFKGNPTNILISPILLPWLGMGGATHPPPSWRDAKMTGPTLNIYVSSLLNRQLQIFTPSPTLDKHEMKAWRCRGTAPLILNVGTRYIWVVSFGCRPLYTDNHL